MSGKPIDEAVMDVQRWDIGYTEWGAAIQHKPNGAFVKLDDVAAALTAAQQQGQGGGEAVCDCDATPQNRYPHHDSCAVNTAPPSAPVGVGAIQEDRGEFCSDTAALVFLRLIGNGNPNVERAVERLRSSLIALTQQPAAADEAATGSAVAAIQFALSDPEGMTFLRLWNEGEFDTLQREWPDAPVDIYAALVGAKLAAQHQEPTT